MENILSKRERVERTLNLQPVDRVAIHDQISYNSGVISLYTGKKIEGFNYSVEDICEVIRKTLDACFSPVAPRGTDRVVDEDGFVRKNDNWTTWWVERPFSDTKGLKQYYRRQIDKMRNSRFDLEEERGEHRRKFLELQKMIGDDTVIIDYSQAGLEICWTRAGIDLFSYLYYEEPEIISEWLQAFVKNEIKRVHAIADRKLSPVALVISDLASKGGPIFSPEFLRKEFFPHLTRLVEAWRSHGLKVIYHSDGNWKILIDDFLKCGVDGFYCLEPAVGMDIVELKKKYPKVIWAGGLDGVDLMERGNPEKVRKEVRRQILETDALNAGGLFLGTSSEINPPIKPENYQAMVKETRSIYNMNFFEGRKVTSQ